jgi:predicted phage terminase large subunit-like protein
MNAFDQIGHLDARYRPPQEHLVYLDEMIGPANMRTPEASAEELRLRLSALQEVHRRRAREHFPTFMQYCFMDSHTGRPFAQQWFHDEWSTAMDTGGRVLIIAPRDHGKTSQIIGRALWELGRDPNLRIKIACASDGRAKERLFEVVQHLEYNPRIREVFPRLVQAERGEWSKHKIIVERSAFHRDASIEALGITSTATGGRADLLIADDAVDRRNALSFPALREQIKQAWKSDWTNLLEPDSRIWYICTLWHKDDLSHQLMVNPAFATYFYAIDHAFGAMWPEKWSEANLRARYQEIQSIEFNRGFRNNPVDEDSAIVRDRWIKFSDLARDPIFADRLAGGHLVFFTSYDTAGSPTGNADQDYSASCTIAVDADARRVYVIDSWAARLTLNVMAQQVIKEHRKYNPLRVLIEKVGQASLDEWVLNIEPALAGIIEVTKPRVSKAQRLIAVTPLMERGEVIFSRTLNSDDPAWMPGRGDLVSELLDFPFGKHDDLVDTFSQALDAARRYFLDAWATGGEDEIRLNVGAESGGYLL